MAEKETSKKEFVLVPRISFDEFVAGRSEFTGGLTGFRAYVGKVTNRRPQEWEDALKAYNNRDGRNKEEDKEDK